MNFCIKCFACIFCTGCTVQDDEKFYVVRLEQKLKKHYHQRHWHHVDDRIINCYNYELAASRYELTPAAAALAMALSSINMPPTSSVYELNSPAQMIHEIHIQAEVHQVPADESHATDAAEAAEAAANPATSRQQRPYCSGVSVKDEIEIYAEADVSNSTEYFIF